MARLNKKILREIIIRRLFELGEPFEVMNIEEFIIKMTNQGQTNVKDY